MNSSFNFFISQLCLVINYWTSTKCVRRLLFDYIQVNDHQNLTLIILVFISCLLNQNEISTNDEYIFWYCSIQVEFVPFIQYIFYITILLYDLNALKWISVAYNSLGSASVYFVKHPIWICCSFLSEKLLHGR